MSSKIDLGLLIDALKILTPIAEAIPVLGATVKGSLEAATRILEYAQKVKDNRDEIIALAKHAGELASELVTTLKSLDDLDPIKPALVDFVKTLNDIEAFTQKQTERSFLKRLHKKQRDVDEIKKWDKELTRAFGRFNIKALLDIQARTTAIQAMEEEKSQRELLDRLKPVHAAFFDHLEAARVCLKGTRVDLLADITAWMKDPAGPAVYWLSGAAGTGKTTIAQSVAKTAAEEPGYLSATFFFSRSSDDRRSYGRVIPTLAYQLGSNPLLRSNICAAVASDNDVSIRPVVVQARKLLSDILKPILSTNPPTHLVVVLDALDECNRDDDQLHGGDLMPELLTVFKQFTCVKLFLTSRPEPSIEELFLRRAVNHNSRTLVLHRDVPKDTAQADIEIYLRHELAKVKGNITSEHDFPSDSDFHTLLQRADGLFVYARTAVDYICDRYSKPDRRLAALIQTACGPGSGRYKRLDELYTQILADALEINPMSQTIIKNDLRQVLMALVLAQQELNVVDLAKLISTDQDECARLLRRIASLLNYEHTDLEPIRLMHASFADFLSDQSRCVELHGYGLNPAEDHLLFAECCLHALNGHLRYNICRIGDSSLFNADIPNLKTHIDRYVPAFVRYACLFWAVHWLEHLRAAGDKCRIPLGLLTFCNHHLLHWVELLSLIDGLDLTQRTLPQLIASIRPKAAWMKEDFQALLRDIHFFIQEYHTPTTLSALQVYHSGLVSMPKCALTHQAPDAKIVQLVMGRDDGWAGELVLEGHMSSVTSAVFSPDGLRIVSGSMDYCVRMWDAISGMHKGTMTDHTEPVMSVDFSSDGLHILSCSENGTVLVWDNMRGVSKRPGIGRSYWETIKAVSHDGLLAAGTLPDEDGKIYVWNTAESRSRYTLSLDAEISSIAFSFDDLRMASGCSVGTIHIWNVITGSKQLMLHGHTHWVGSLAFSRDGLKLVSGSHDCTVRVWDAISGTHQFAFTGHTNSILSVEFSPNSAQIVSGSADTTVRVWDAKMSLGTQQHRAPKARLTPAEVKFLPGGLHIIEWHSADNCMRLWDAVSGMLQHTLTSASDDGIWCISCSSDGLKIASGSNFDGTVRVWSVISGACLLTLNGHTSSASAVNFSSDNSKIVSGSWDHSVRVWDAVSGILLQTLDGHPAPIIEAVFSDDGQLVISDSIQGTRYVWETATGRLWEKSQHTPPTLQFPISHPSEFCEKVHKTDKFEFNITTGWLSRRENDGSSRRLCWIPHKRRYDGFMDSFDQRVCISSTNGVLTLLDCSPLTPDNPDATVM